MKRFFVALTLLLFVAACLQIPVHAHYCMEKLQDWQLYAEAESCCEHTQHPTPHFVAPCCQDKKAWYLLSEYYSPKAKVATTFSSYFSDYQHITGIFFRQGYKPKLRFVLPGPAPPQSVPIFLLHAVFRL